MPPAPGLGFTSSLTGQMGLSVVSEDAILGIKEKSLGEKDLKWVIPECDHPAQKRTERMTIKPSRASIAVPVDRYFTVSSELLQGQFYQLLQPYISMGYQ